MEMVLTSLGHLWRRWEKGIGEQSAPLRSSDINVHLQQVKAILRSGCCLPLWSHLSLLPHTSSSTSAIPESWCCSKPPRLAHRPSRPPSSALHYSLNIQNSASSYNLLRRKIKLHNPPGLWYIIIIATIYQMLTNAKFNLQNKPIKWALLLSPFFLFFTISIL